MSSEGALSGAEACLVLRPPPSEGPWPQCAWRSWAGGAEGLQRTAHEGGAECSGSAPPPVNESLPSSTCPRPSRLTSKVSDLGACLHMIHVQLQVSVGHQCVCNVATVTLDPGSQRLVGVREHPARGLQPGVYLDLSLRASRGQGLVRLRESVTSQAPFLPSGPCTILHAEELRVRGGREAGPWPGPSCAAWRSSPHAPTAQALNDVSSFTHKIAVGSNGDHPGKILNWNLQRQMQGERLPTLCSFAAEFK